MNVCSGESDNDNGCSMIVCSGEKASGMAECNDDVEKMIVNDKDETRVYYKDETMVHDETIQRTATSLIRMILKRFTQEEATAMMNRRTRVQKGILAEEAV